MNNTKTKKIKKEKDPNAPKRPMPQGKLFEIGNTAASKYKEEYADLMFEYAERDDLIYPSVEGFCLEYNIPHRTMTRWIAECKEDPDKHPRLATSYARLMARQKEILIIKGLTDAYNAQIVKFLLTNNHGMSEKTSNEVNAKTDNKFEVNIKVID